MSGETGGISKYQSEVDLVVEWGIFNFFNLPEEEGAFYWSPKFSFGGERWELWIFPNGWSGRDSSGHVDLGLYKCLSGRCIRQHFSLSLKTAKGEKYHEKHCTRDFKFYDSHVFNRFIPRSELILKSSELVPWGELTVVCTMKNTTSAESESTGFPQLQGWNAFGNYAFGYGGQGYGYNQGGFGNYGQGGNYNGTQANAASASAECRHCKETFSAGSLSSHRKKCMHRPTKCPDCLEVVSLEKWLNEHECQQGRPEGEACASVCSDNPHQNNLQYDFKQLFLQKEDCDVMIKVKGSEFQAHRIILKARSPVFASTFRHNMKENATGVLEIEDCDPSTFSDFLCFLYCGDVGIISQENVFGLFTAADKYQVLYLRAKCLEFIKDNLTVDTFCETITLALQHSETELIKLCTDYFKKNAPKIVVTVKWQTFLKENPTESNELIVKLLLPDDSSSK